MRFRFIVEAEASRTEGKFESRDTLGEQLLEAIDEADPGQIEGDNGGQYEIVQWEVSEEVQK